MHSQTIITLLIVGIVISKTLIAILIYYLIRKNRLLKMEQLKLTTANSILNEQALQIQRYNDELKMAESFKTKVLSIASHDLRAPFASIQVLLSINDISLIDTKELSLVFNDLKQQVSRSRQLLEEVLLWTESQLRDKLENTERCNIQEQIKCILEMYAKELEQAKINVVNTVDPGFSVDTHKEILSFVLRNVISNAVKYGRVGGLIQLQLIDDKTDRWGLTITNEGDELSPELLYNLNFVNSWERKKVENSKGAGLGISLCKDLVKRINGSLTFENKPDVGVAVTLELLRET